VILFPTSLFLWQVKGFEDITIESLTLVSTLRPKPEILLLGTGKHFICPHPDLINFFREKEISVEPMHTLHACSTFNILNSEERFVAAALLPISYVQTPTKKET